MADALNSTLLLQIHWYIQEPRAQITSITDPGGSFTKARIPATTEYGDQKEV